MLGGRDADGFKRVSGGLGGAKVASLAGAVSAMADCEALASLALDRFGRIDVLVNNAGVDHLGKMDEGEIGEFSRIIETDLYGVVQMSRAAIAALRRLAP